MSGPDRNAERAALVPIDWWPDGWRLSAIIRRSRVAVQPAAALGLRRGVSTYGDWPLKDRELARDYGHWVYGGASNLEYANESMNFEWDPPIVPPEVAAPDAFAEQLVEEKWTSMQRDWPPILLDLRMIVDRTQAGSSGLTLNLAAAVDRGLWRNGTSVECAVRIRTYASAMAPPRAKIQCNEPMPTEIRGDYFGQPIRIPSCLHPYVELESLNNSDALIAECTPTRANTRTGNKLTYQPTNHQTWESHIFSNDVTRDGGLYRRVESTVFPPRMTGITYT